MSTRVSILALIVALLASRPAVAQVTMRPTPSPDATAEKEGWYTSGLPIAFGGGVYYPSGPTTHFVGNEMVPAGTFEGVTIYVRTTIEPGSIIYVPLPGGLVRPFERRRRGDLAGTVGSTAPRFPVSLAPEPERLPPGLVQTPYDDARPVGTAGRVPARDELVEPPGSTGGSTGLSVSQLPAVRPPRFSTVLPPAGVNALFVQYEGKRWFSAGRAVELATAPLSRIGEYQGFDVYAHPGLPDTIFVASLDGTSELVTPYRAR